MKPILCVISGSRADYGLLKNVLLPLKKSKSLNSQFIVTGSHLSSKHGNTIKEIKDDNMQIDAELKILSSDDSSVGIAEALSKGIDSTAKTLKKLNPSMVLVLGDRYEIFAASIAAMISNIPISHIHGGENTEAAIDEAIRHSLTKMSCFHFVTTEEYRKRVIQLGENPERVFFVGALGLDSVKNTSLLTRKELEERFGVKLKKRLLMITYHSVTLEREDNLKNLSEILKAIDKFKDFSLVFTSPNADHDGGAIKDVIEAYVKKNNNAHFFSSLGQNGYLSFLKEAECVIGNSSSGIFEAPYCKVGSVNVGNRQKGRLKPKSVIDVPNNSMNITDAINHVLSKDFKKIIKDQENPFGDGDAGERIVSILENELNQPNKEFLKKEFFNLTPENIQKNGFWYS
tara:strand:+ start:248 stop:1450 length:1203 start_codon:yes stop_codon:yes gene_type:complete